MPMFTTISQSVGTRRPLSPPPLVTKLRYTALGRARKAREGKKTASSGDPHRSVPTIYD